MTLPSAPKGRRCCHRAYTPALGQLRCAKESPDADVVVVIHMGDVDDAVGRAVHNPHFIPVANVPLLDDAETGAGSARLSEAVGSP